MSPTIEGLLETEGPRRLPCLEIVDLVDELLEFSDGVAALLGTDLLINGQCHGLGILAHLADHVLIRLGSGLIVVYEHGAELLGYPLGCPGLMEKSHELLAALLPVGNPGRFHIGEREAPFPDLCLLFLGQPSQPVLHKIQSSLSPLL